MTFNSAEISFVSSNKYVLKRLREKHKIYELVDNLVEHPEIYFPVILTGINLSIVIFSVIASFKGNIISSSIVSTIFILIFGEIIPKIVTLKKPEFFASIYAIPIKFLYYPFYPIIFIMKMFSHWLLRFLNIEESDKDITKSEIELILRKNFEDKILKKEEYIFLKKIISLSVRKVQDIMIPRTKIVAIDIREGVEGLFKLYCEKRFTKIPVYKENIDNIIGIVNVRDAFKKKDKKLEDLIMPALFISEEKTCDEVLIELLKEPNKTAIIVDEYGGTAGFVKLDDLFINFVSETIVEEKHTKGTYILKGDAKLNLLGIDTEETVSGYLIKHLKRIPEEGEEFNIEEYIFKIIDATDREIRKVMVVKK